MERDAIDKQVEVRAGVVAIHGGPQAHRFKRLRKVVLFLEGPAPSGKQKAIGHTKCISNNEVSDRSGFCGRLRPWPSLSTDA